MKINIVFIADNETIPKKEIEFVKVVIKKHSRKIDSLMPFKVKNFTFTVYSRDCIGVGGFTQAVDWVQLNINFKQLFRKGEPNEELMNQLIYVIYHEMHHACRGYAGYLPKNQEHILINSIISEGLADHFAREQYPCGQVSKTTDYDLSEIASWIKKLGKVLWDKESNDDSWIFGGGTKPKMLGYKIGRHIIQEVKDKNPKFNSINLVRTTPEKILKLSGIKFD